MEINEMTRKDCEKFDKMMNAVKSRTSAAWFKAFCSRFMFCTFEKADGVYDMPEDIHEIHPQFVSFDEYDGTVCLAMMVHFDEAISVLRNNKDVVEEVREMARG